jgi:beta-lactamase regulating signal transducer with metallopeptidase domain
MRRFSKVLAQTRLAPIAIQTEVEVLSRQVGLRCAPQVRATRRRTAPLVWAFGRRATILLPAELLTQLTCDELRALLLHELAHVRRRDHLTKLVELAAVAIYWWLPTAWWARRQADRATERCCDAEVVAQLRSAPGSYATALVKTLDFLSYPTDPLPLGASGFSQFRHVSRRIEMILQPAPVSRALWRHRLALVSLSAIVLPGDVQNQVKQRDALRKQLDSLTSAYEAREAEIEELLSTQRKLVDAEAALTRVVFPKSGRSDSKRTIRVSPRRVRASDQRRVLGAGVRVGASDSSVHARSA